jgi:GYD domain
MPLYLIEGQQSPESWARLTLRPENREQASREGAHHHDGRNVGYWYALDPGHVFSIIEAKDEVSAAALLSAMFGSGAFQHVRTVVLLTPEQMLEALNRARDMPYSPPGGHPADDN